MSSGETPRRAAKLTSPPRSSCPATTASPSATSPSSCQCRMVSAVSPENWTMSSRVTDRSLPAPVPESRWGGSRAATSVPTGDVVGNELGVASDPADQHGSGRVEPRKTKEINTGLIRDAAAVPRSPAVVENVGVNETVVRTKACRPQHITNSRFRAICKRDAIATRPDRARAKPSTPAADASSAGVRRQVWLPRQVAADTAIDVDVEEVPLARPPEDVAAEDVLGRRHGRPAAHRHLDGAPCPEKFLGDLATGGEGADDEYGSRRHISRVPVAG